MKNNRPLILVLSAGLVLAGGLTPAFASEEVEELTPATVAEETTPAETAETVEPAVEAPAAVETPQPVETPDTPEPSETPQEVPEVDDEEVVDDLADVEVEEGAPLLPITLDVNGVTSTYIPKTTYTYYPSEYYYRYYTVDGVTYRYYPYSDYYYYPSDYYRYYTKDGITYRYYPYGDYYYYNDYYYYPTDYYRYYTVDGVTYRYYPYSDYYYRTYREPVKIESTEVEVGRGYTTITAGTYKRADLKDRRSRLQAELDKSRTKADSVNLLVKKMPKLATKNLTYLSSLLAEATDLQEKAQSAIVELDAILGL